MLITHCHGKATANEVMHASSAQRQHQVYQQVTMNNAQGSPALYLAVVDDLFDFSVLPLSKFVLGKVLGKEVSHSLDWHYRVLTDQVPVLNHD